MILFKREKENKQYKIGDSVLPIAVLLDYPHTIEGDSGTIDLPYEIGDAVWRYPCTLDRAAGTNRRKEVISEFTIFGGKISVRFVGSSVPHSIECIAPV